MQLAATLTWAIVRARIGCESCGLTDNAAELIKKRVIHRILELGSDLSNRDVLLADNGRVATSKTRRAKVSRARGSEASKKKRKAAKAA